MSRWWTVITHLHAAAGPVVMLLYPLYASIVAIESTSKVDDEQWLAYWILYSFITLLEMVIQPILECPYVLHFTLGSLGHFVGDDRLLQRHSDMLMIPIWYTVKLVFMAWLVLPQFQGAAFLYEKFVRENVLKKYGGGLGLKTANNGKSKD